MKQTNVTRTASEVIDIVNDSPASMFTKSDVIALIKSIKENDTTAIQFKEEMIDDLIEYLNSDIYSLEAADVLDADTAEFEIIDGNTIVLKDVEVDNTFISDTIEDALRQWFDKNVL